jgi:hypothetical protein
VEDERMASHDCPIPERYAFNLTDNKHDNNNAWCTITSSTEDIESAAGLMLHAPDTNFGNIPQRKKL